LEEKNSKNKVPGMILVNRYKGYWIVDLMVFKHGFNQSLEPVNGYLIFAAAVYDSRRRSSP
jgi:hypothetical protein